MEKGQFFYHASLVGVRVGQTSLINIETKPDFSTIIYLLHRLCF